MYSSAATRPAHANFLRQAEKGGKMVLSCFESALFILLHLRLNVLVTFVKKMTSSSVFYYTGRQVQKDRVYTATGYLCVSLPTSLRSRLEYRFAAI